MACCDLDFVIRHDLGLHMGVPRVDPFSASSLLPENYLCMCWLQGLAWILMLMGKNLIWAESMGFFIESMR